MLRLAHIQRTGKRKRPALRVNSQRRLTQRLWVRLPRIKITSMENKMRFEQSVNENLYTFDVCSLNDELKSEPGIYIFTNRIEVSRNNFQHQHVDSGLTKNLSQISNQVYLNAINKGANCILVSRFILNNHEKEHGLDDIKTIFEIQ
jgi:hypothetical protein